MHTQLQAFLCRRIAASSPDTPASDDATSQSPRAVLESPADFLEVLMRAALLLLLLCSTQVLADACIVHSQGDLGDVKVCQQNRSIPPNLFKSGFCSPQLKGQKVEVSFVEQCPAGAFGVCRNAQAQGMPYKQDIHYYGVASDARYLKLYCEGQSKGVWMAY